MKPWKPPAQILLEPVMLEGGEHMYAHPADTCKGEACTIHKMTDHHMREWPQHWRKDRGIMERICPHGVGHPDPDEYKIYMGIEEGDHGCDGCCWPGARNTYAHET